MRIHRKVIILCVFFSFLNYAQDITLEKEFFVVSIEGIEILDNSATMISDGQATPNKTDICAAIKKSGDIFLQVKLKPDIDENDLPSNFIKWKGGIEFQGHQLQRKVSKNVWGKTVVEVSCSSIELGYRMIVYVIGADPTGFSPPNGISGTHFTDNEMGYTSTGIFGPDPTDGAYESKCEIQFTIKPDELVTDANNELFDTSEIKWDVSRERQELVWIKYSSIWIIDPDNQSTDWVSDDKYDVEEDNNPWNGNGHLYGNDKPEWEGIGDAVVDKMNMREWIRVGLSGISGRDGERCSEYKFWHVFRSIKKNTIWLEDNTYENEIAENNIFWGNTPTDVP